MSKDKENKIVSRRGFIKVAAAGAGGTVDCYTNEAGYRSGWHLTNALTFGRIAGKNMAAEKPWA